ncbi:CYTH domain-containing protein [uncultured Corynebacterium sp.]|uniref:CYTH domain-containing protein n=1 Tax=uncultured Corynebacterium sp. TaxID=159447 RepID=UPI00263108EE|nr:CYTH domain-containing protein [uncultured Corynebacterium sp.]
MPVFFKKKRAIPALAVCIASVLCAVPDAGAAAVATPDYQVKLRLSDAAVDAQGAPSPQFRSYFDVLSESGSEQAVYFDTADGMLANHGWTARLRHKDGAENYDITYKYRLPLGDNSLSKSTVEDGLDRARKQNFDASDTNYDAQVNASFATSTLDFSNKKSAACVTSQCEIPSVDDAVAIVTDLEPGKLKKATGTTLAAADLKMSRTVNQQTWRVEVGGIKTDLEVAKFGNQVWVEISEEDTSRKDAIRKRETLIAELEKAGLLEHEDAFKTGAVLASGWQE